MSVKIVKAVFDRSPQKGSARNVLLALAEWADDAGVAFPSVSSIATKARVSESTVHAALRKLVAAGELVVSPNAGRHGTNVYRILDAGGQQLALLEGGASSTRGAESAPVLLAAPEPSSPVGDLSKRGTDGQGADSAPVQISHPPSERGAVRVWLAARRMAGQAHWTDPAGLRQLREQMGRAVRKGATWADVELALRAYGADPKASVWYVVERILVVQHDRVEREGQRTAARARELADRDRDARVDREWRELEARYPGKTRAEIAHIELRARRAG